MTDADVLRDCALILRSAQGEIAKRRGSLRNLHAIADLDFAIAGLADCIDELDRKPEERDEEAEQAEFVEWQGRMRRAAI